MKSGSDDALRKAAEAALASGEISPRTDPELERSRIIHELRVRQAELELQNGELVNLQQRADAQRERYQALFNAFPLPTLLIDIQGLVQDVNRSAMEAFGFKSRDQLRRHSMYRLIHGDALQAFGVTARAMMDKETRSLGLGWIHGPSDSSLPVELQITAMRIGVYLDRLFLLVCIDQTDALERERQAQLFNSVLENTESAIYAFDTEGRTLLANPIARSLFITQDQDPIGKLRSSLVSARDEETYAQHDVEVFRKRQSILFEETLTRENGTVQHFVSQKFPLFNESGNLFAVGGVSTEITALKIMNERWQLASQVFENGSESIILTDAAQRITMVNRCFTETTGYTESEIIGKTPQFLESGRHDKKFFENIFETIEREGFWEGEVWNRRKHGEIYPEWMRLTQIKDNDGVLKNYVSISRDISQYKNAEEQINHLAFYDPLTGLPNRELLRDRSQQAIALADRCNTQLALCFIDLDEFKQVNDALGHDHGDQLLIEIARRLKSELRANDTISRIGGDEFVLLLPDTSIDSVAIRLSTILAKISQPVDLTESNVTVSASVGIALFPGDGKTFENLLRSADTAMYQAKQSGRNQQRFFDREMAQRARARMNIEMALDQAIGNDEFELHYQPFITLENECVSGCEALLRWNSASLGKVSPGEFIPIAEITGRIVRIGKWVMETALEQRRRWQDQVPGDYAVAVNMSANEFQEPDLVSLIERRLEAHQLPAHALEIEITERTAMRNPEQTIKTMHELKDLGVRLSIDDFGTGYSSLAYLRSMPVDHLKMDISFVSEIGRSRENESICRFVVDLARSLGIHVIAEGVETDLQKAFLTGLGCNYAQGYLLGRPMSADHFVQRLGSGGALDSVPSAP